MKYLVRFSTHNGIEIWFEENSIYTCLKKVILEKRKYLYVDLFFKIDGEMKLKSYT